MHNAEISAQNITRIYGLIQPCVRRTPVIEVDGRDFGLPPVRIFFKLEHLQHGGSFKARGAFANLLSRKIPAVGVAAASGGNHGVAVAFAASVLKKPARIFVPTIASREKIDRIRGYGANLVIGGDRYADALAASDKWARENGALTVHAYDQVETMLGQGTLGLEFEEQSPGLDALLVAVGGGGLVAGVATWYGNRVEVTGVEPEVAPTLTLALEAGAPVDSPAGGIAADSLAPKRVGELVLPVIQSYVNRVILVTDDAIREAQLALWKVLRVVAEPGGSAAFSALLSGRYKANAGERIGVVICGANTTAVNFDGAASAKSS
jgi:threonine dehydratase